MMDKPLENNNGAVNPPNLLTQLLTILIFTGTIALLAVGLTWLMTLLLNLG
jgi:hypothetical protein